MLLSFDASVPLPRLDRRGKPTIYPFALMGVGDSFPVPDDVRAVRSAAHSFARRHPGFTFVVRRTPDGVETRCWRIA